jgi:hypothetical protein
MLQKLKWIIIPGIAFVFLAYTLDPTIGFILKHFRSNGDSTIQNIPHWQYFTNLADRYVVQFPSKPFINPQKLKENPAIVSYQQYVAILGSNDVFMMATLTTSWTNDFTEEQINHLLDRTAQGALGESGKLLAMRDIAIGGYLGREIEFVRSNKWFMKMRYYHVGNRLQEMTVMMSQAGKQSTNASYFFDSLRIFPE